MLSSPFNSWCLALLRNWNAFLCRPCQLYPVLPALGAAADVCLSAMQWAAVCHQHAVWCGRCTHQCFGQPAGILIQLQWPPQSNRFCSAAGRPCSDWQCLCVVHLFIFIRLPDSGESLYKRLQICFHFATVGFLFASFLLLLTHTLVSTLCYSLKFRHSHPFLSFIYEGRACLQWMLLACFSLPSSVSTCCCCHDYVHSCVPFPLNSKSIF